VAIQRENNHLALQPITDEFIHSLRRARLRSSREREQGIEIEKDGTAK
jgi:hypothetical protein